MKPSGDHQMQNQPQIALDADYDAFADAPDFANGAILERRKGWIGGAQQRGTLDPHAFQDLADDTLFQS